MKLLPVLALACVLMLTVHDRVAAQQSLFTIHQLPSSERPATLPASRPIVQVNGAVFSEVGALPDDAEVRIQQLEKNAAGAFELKPFEADESAE